MPSPRNALAAIFPTLLLATLSPLFAVDDGGVLDHGTYPFDLGATASDIGSAVAILPDGRILLAGTVASGSANVAALVRLLPDGSPDLTFGAGTGRVVNPCSLFLPSSARTLHLLDGGRILLGGSLLYGSSGDILVWRLEEDGACDATFGEFGIQGIPFDLGGDEMDTGSALAVDSLGRIVVAGTAEFAGSDTDIAVARLLPGGGLDPSFSGDGKMTIPFDLTGAHLDAGLAVALDRDDRIVVAGAAFDASGGDYEIAVARVAGNGELDETFGDSGRRSLAFDLGGSNNEFARGVALWPDGEIVLVGPLATGPSVQEWQVVRLAADGDIVLGATHGQYFSSPSDASAVVLQGDGKITFAGFGMGSTSPDFGIGRLLRDGTPDPSFALGWGVTTFDFAWGGSNVDAANAITLDHDGRIVAAGQAEFDAPDNDFAWLRIESSYIFADGFEWGDTSRWSATAP